MDSAVISTVIALPIIIAAVVSLWPGEKPRKKLVFTLISASLTYGFATFAYVLAMPVGMVIYEIDGYLVDTDRVVLGRVLLTFVEAMGVAAWVVGAVSSVLVPVYLRRKLWTRIVDPNDR